MRLVLNPKMKEYTVLGFEWLEPVSYGYDAKGVLQSILCKAPLADGYRIDLFTVEATELDDVFMYYTVEMEGE